MKKISLYSFQALNAIFNSYSSDPNTVIWICEPDYSRQIFLSDNYQTVWGRKPDILYQDLSQWRTYINQDDISEVGKRIAIPKAKPNQIDQLTSVYRVVHPNEKVVFVKDVCLPLMNDNNQISALAGIAIQVSENEWQTLTQKGENNVLNSICLPNDELSRFSRLFKEEFVLDVGCQSQTPTAAPSVVVQNKTYTITKREAECLQQLRQGYSSKQIANKIHCSPRTVELHIDNVRRKIGVRNRIELVSLIDNILT